jgi:DNA polymerase
MHNVAMHRPGDFGEFRDAARLLVGADVPPGEVLWHEGGETGLFAETTPADRGDVYRSGGLCAAG